MKLNIAVLGTRGIPNHYGGFEYVASELAARLVEKGHTVTVYNAHRHPYQNKEWNGVQIIHCFDPEFFLGTAGQFIYDLNCIRNTRKKNFDIILMLGYTSSSVWSFLYPEKAVVITNMDGLEWQRTKYNSITKRFLKYAEKKAIRRGQFYIADSPVIKTYLDEKYGINSRYIAYGVPEKLAADESLLSEYGLKKNKYFMLMARIEPENNIEMILDGFCFSSANSFFIVIGNTGNRFGKYLVNKFSNNKRIIFAGSVYDGQKLQSLVAFCNLYFHGHSVGGTNPSLLAAMAESAPIAAHDNPFNRSVLKENALFFDDATEVSAIIKSNKFRSDQYVQNNKAAIANEFNWSRVTQQYEDYFMECYQIKHSA